MSPLKKRLLTMPAILALFLALGSIIATALISDPESKSAIDAFGRYTLLAFVFLVWLVPKEAQNNIQKAISSSIALILFLY